MKKRTKYVQYFKKTSTLIIITVVIFVSVVSVWLAINHMGTSIDIPKARHPWDDALFEDIGTSLELSQNTPYGSLALQHIAYINDHMYGRFAFSDSEKEAAVWLVQMLLAMGYKWEDIQVQEISGIPDYHDEWVYRQGNQPREYSQNVILTIPGQSEQTIIVGAHYDSYNPGICDNGSGVALLLESAQRMRGLDNYYTIVYVFFGAEEIGLIGSQYYLDALSEEERDCIFFMINADSLFLGDDLLYMAGYNEQHTSSADNIVREWDVIANTLQNSHGIELIPFPDGVERWGSDHYTFYSGNIPVVMLMGLSKREDGEFVSIGHIQHTPQDSLDYYNKSWPGRVDRALWVYSLFLEEILLHRY